MIERPNQKNTPAFVWLKCSMNINRLCPTSLKGGSTSVTEIACFYLSLVLILASLRCKLRNEIRIRPQVFPRALMSARFVYVTSITGREFRIRADPEDRAAIETVQEALQNWGRYTLLDKPVDADLIFNGRARAASLRHAREC